MLVTPDNVVQLELSWTFWEAVDVSNQTVLRKTLLDHNNQSWVPSKSWNVHIFKGKNVSKQLTLDNVVQLELSWTFFEGRKNLFPVLVLDWGDRPIPFTDYFKQALFHKSMICDFSSKMYYIRNCKIFKIDIFKSSSLKHWRILKLFSSLESCECQLSNEPKNLKIGQ